MQYKLLGVSILLVALGYTSYSVSVQDVDNSEGNPGIVIWSADHEMGDLQQWKGIWTSGNADAKISTTYAHSGTYALALTIYNADGTPPQQIETPGVRMAVNHIDLEQDDPQQILLQRSPPGSKSVHLDLPDEAYYSVWFFFPYYIESPVWWNVFQWKRRWVQGETSSSDPTYTVNVGNREEGAMRFHLYSHVSHKGEYEPEDEAERVGIGKVAVAAVDIPLQHWVHLECFYRWSTADDGAIQCWQDGEELWHIRGIIAEFDYGDVEKSRQWTVNNYSIRTIPSTHTLYIDDAQIKVLVSQ